MLKTIQAKLQPFLEPPRYHVGPVFLNRIGLQYVRVLFHNFIFGWIRPSVLTAKARHELSSEIDQLAKEGYCKIENFLSEQDFAKLSQAYDRYRNSDWIKHDPNRGNTGVTWVEGPIVASGNKKAEAEQIIALLANHPKLIQLGSLILGKKIRGPLLLGFQWLILPENESDDRDMEGVLHADRHYPCAKAIYFINSHSVSNGTYTYCPGTHTLTRYRLRYEHDLAIQQQLSKKRTFTPSRDWAYLRGRPTIPERFMGVLNVKAKPIEAPPNTLVISNNMGFHKRGTMTPGTERKEIRIIFYDYQAPLLGRMIKRLYKTRKYGLSMK